MFECKICNKQFETKQKLGGHVSSHFRNETYKKNRKSQLSIKIYEKKQKNKIEGYNCIFCIKSFKKPQSLGGHIVSCKNNPKSEYNKEQKRLNKKPFKHTDETKEKIRQKQLLAIKNGKIIKAGRSKKYEYNSKFAGKILVDGTWELKFCKWADENNLPFERNKIGFKYKKTNCTESYYFPDFKLKELNVFIEIKGYETELDNLKWAQFPYELIILKKEDLVSLQIL